MTLLTEAQILAAGCVRNPNPSNFRATSYDLAINVIIDSEGRQHAEICLAPGEMATIVSEEFLELSPSITGVAHYLTRLTKRGVWSQTIGIIDPHWKGPLSTTIINQSKVQQSLKKGDRYIRVTFFEHGPTPNKYDAGNFSHAEYVRLVESEAATYMPRSFLSTDKIAQDAGKTVFERMRNSMLTWVGIAALLFALITFFAPFATNWATKSYWDSYVQSRETTDETTTQALLSERQAQLGRIDALERRVQSLEESLRARQPATAPR